MTTVYFTIEIDTDRYDHLHPSIALEDAAADAAEALSILGDRHSIRLAWAGRVREGRPEDYDEGPYHIDDPRSNG